MSNEWKPVVGGRAMYLGDMCFVVDMWPDANLGAAEETFTCLIHRQSDEYAFEVKHRHLREHPDDARHRLLLDAARRVRVAEAALSRATEHPDWDGLVEAVGESQSALAALYAIIDEADHAS